MNSSSYNLSLPFTGEGMTFEADEYFKPGEELDFAGFRIETIPVPGHTIGSVCYYLKSRRFCFPVIHSLQARLEEAISYRKCGTAYPHD